MKKKHVILVLLAVLMMTAAACDLARPWSLDDWVDLVTNPGKLADAVQEAEQILDALPEGMIPEDLPVGK